MDKHSGDDHQNNMKKVTLYNTDRYFENYLY